MMFSRNETGASILSIKEHLKNARILVYPIVALILFSICGQTACSQLAPVKEMSRCLITIAVTFLEIYIFFAVIRFLTRSDRVFLWVRRILGVTTFVFMLFAACLLVFAAPNRVETYGTGWWIGQVDKLEEEQRLWSASHWVGRGDTYYEYDDSIVKKPAETEAEAMEEPYHSALDERARTETAYKFYYSDTMLNVLSYAYGRWVWLIYLAIVIAWTAAGIWASSQVCGIYAKLLYFASWMLFTVVIWLPVLNGCGLHFSYYGPPFTGFNSAYWEFNLLMVGPPLGIMFSFTLPKEIQKCDY